ncbi:hypothetical protein GTW51_09970 [Aurantimonas aggregata]|uniref:histidine kinase n=1 Tax=Aurantimonas aggregata TaxID=2047720 RepID=A0A6L9MH95_9HYPH|nr:hypothetical protein [Aurantimonas aggregata]NDV87028.1 hypothetical protein [Aurantimonas aggregata]
MAIAMALHELCTNAVKYGSLSVEDGYVSIDWSIRESEQGRRLHFAWTKRGARP